MKKFTDQSGWVRVLVCCLTLVVHHGLRDALIPALPTIAASTDTNSLTTDFSTTTDWVSTDGISSDFPDGSFSPTVSTTDSDSVLDTATASLSLNLGPTAKGPSEAAAVTDEPSRPHILPSDAHGAAVVDVAQPSEAPTHRDEPSETITRTTAVNSASRSLAGLRDSNTISHPRGTLGTATPSPEGHPRRGQRSLTSPQNLESPPTPTRPTPSNALDSPSSDDSGRVAGGSRLLVVEEAEKDSADGNVKVTYSVSGGPEDLPRRIASEILAGRIRGEDLSERLSDEDLAKRIRGGEITEEELAGKIAGEDLAGRVKSLFSGQMLVRGVFDVKDEDRDDPTRNEVKSNATSSRENPLSVLIKSLDFSSVWLKLSGRDGAPSGPGERNGGPLKKVGLRERFFHDGTGWVHEVRRWEYEVEGYEEVYQPPEMKDGWTLVLEGAVLSAVYWAWLFTAAFADKLVDKLGVGPVLALSVGLTGILGLVTHTAALGGPWALLGIRVFQGVVQGVSFPAVLRVLEDIPEAMRNLASFVVFLGPYLGTSLGVGFGSLEEWYIVMYCLGGVALCLVPPCFMLPAVESNIHEELAWRRVLRSRAVLACMGVHIASTWVLHTLIVGVPFCLVYYMGRPWASGWSTLLVVATVALVSRPLVYFSRRVGDKGSLSILDRRRAPVLAGSLLVVTSLILLATLGLELTGLLVGAASGLAGVGVGLLRVGNRLNIEDLAPLQLWRLVHVFNLVGAFVAAVVPLVVTALAEVGRDGWIAVWLVPLVLVIPAALLHLFCLSSNVQSFDIPASGYDGPAGSRPVRVSTISVGGLEGVIANGHGPPREQRRSVRSRQSFKSAHSALTFKTAMSRPRARTLSCRTIDDDLEADLKSVVEEASVDCRSIALESEVECRSVASTTFKSECDDMFSAIEGDGPPSRRESREQPHPLYNGTSLDRTTAWLSYHYAVGTLQRANSVQQPSKDEARRKNSIFALAW